jgi:TonB family protein
MTRRFRLFFAPALLLGLAAPGAEGADPGTAKPKGSMDKEIIAKVVRERMPEVKTCYERELAEKPELKGRVVVKFTIGLEGKVVTSVLERSTLGVPRAENCIVQAIKGWEFPRPADGDVEVSYPFVFEPR